MVMASSTMKTVLALAAMMLTGLAGSGAAEERPLEVYILVG